MKIERKFYTKWFSDSFCELWWKGRPTLGAIISGTKCRDKLIVFQMILLPILAKRWSTLGPIICGTKHRDRPLFSAKMGRVNELRHKIGIFSPCHHSVDDQATIVCKVLPVTSI